MTDSNHYLAALLRGDPQYKPEQPVPYSSNYRLAVAVAALLRAGPQYKPGQLAPYSGQYALYDARGNWLGREVTVVKGEPFPPTPSSGGFYRLFDPTLHGCKQGLYEWWSAPF